MGRSREPFLWALFGAGGMIAALVYPALVAVLWIAAPLGWVRPPSEGGLLELVQNPVVRLFLFVLLTLSLFHWAHRFRYTMYDGLQLYHLSQLIAVVTYGMATIGTLAAAYFLWSFP